MFPALLPQASLPARQLSETALCFLNLLPQEPILLLQKRCHLPMSPNSPSPSYSVQKDNGVACEVELNYMVDVEIESSTSQITANQVIDPFLSKIT